MAIHRLLYRSDIDLAGTAAGIQQQIVGIVRLSAERNAAAGLTGALLHTRGVFIQALEGPLHAIETTFERICCDLRHRRVALLELVQAEDRVFAEWSMARISSDRQIERLFSCLPPNDEHMLETASAQATIRLMRALLCAVPDRSSSPDGLARSTM